MCDVCWVGVTALVKCDVGRGGDVTGLIAICDGFCFAGVTGFDLLVDEGWGSLAGFDRVGITADGIDGITVVTGVDGDDTVDEALPRKKNWI